MPTSKKQAGQAGRQKIGYAKIYPLGEPVTTVKATGKEFGRFSRHMRVAPTNVPDIPPAQVVQVKTRAQVQEEAKPIEQPVDFTVGGDSPPLPKAQFYTANPAGGTIIFVKPKGEFGAKPEEAHAIADAISPERFGPVLPLNVGAGVDDPIAPSREGDPQSLAWDEAETIVLTKTPKETLRETFIDCPSESVKSKPSKEADDRFIRGLQTSEIADFTPKLDQTTHHALNYFGRRSPQVGVQNLRRLETLQDLENGKAQLSEQISEQSKGWRAKAFQLHENWVQYCNHHFYNLPMPPNRSGKRITIYHGGTICNPLTTKREDLHTSLSEKNYAFLTKFATLANAYNELICSNVQGQAYDFTDDFSNRPQFDRMQAIIALYKELESMAKESSKYLPMRYKLGCDITKDKEFMETHNKGLAYHGKKPWFIPSSLYINGTHDKLIDLGRFNTFHEYLYTDSDGAPKTVTISGRQFSYLGAVENPAVVEEAYSKLKENALIVNDHAGKVDQAIKAQSDVKEAIATYNAIITSYNSQLIYFLMRAPEYLARFEAGELDLKFYLAFDKDYGQALTGQVVQGERL